MLRPNAKVELIKRAPLFERCSKRELKAVAALADEMDFPPGKTLTREGAPGREFFVLIEGSAEVRRKGRKINTMQPGDFFGEIALVTGQPRTATVTATATSPVRALVLTDRAFKDLLRRTPSMQQKVLEALADRLPAETVYETL